MFDIDFIDFADLKVRDSSESEGQFRKDAGLTQKIQYDGTSPTSEALGQIVIGSFIEVFRAPLFFWSKQDYQTHWRSALKRLISGGSQTALLTTMYDPLKANFITWWPMYREGDLIVIQNEMLILDELPRPFDIANMDEFVRPRETLSDDGDTVSEWTVLLSDIKNCRLLR